MNYYLTYVDMRSIIKIVASHIMMYIIPPIQLQIEHIDVSNEHSFIYFTCTSMIQYMLINLMRLIIEH